MEKNAKIYVAGHTGLFGTAICEELEHQGFHNLILKKHRELDLRNQASTNLFFQEERPDYVVLAAAKVGGIQANRTQMADFIMENMQIECNVLSAAHETKVKKLLFLGSSCLYPKEAEQPVKETAILSGSCEPTNEGFAIAKIAGIRMCEYYHKQYGDNFISCIPANVYGPGDDFDPQTGHVISSLLARMHYAKMNHLPKVEIWGSGIAEREFLYIEDAAKACIQLLEDYEEAETINLGVGATTSIKQLAYIIKDVVGYEGEIVFDITKPNGMLKRRLDSSKAIALGITAKTSLGEGIEKKYEWYLSNKK